MTNVTLDANYEENDKRESHRSFALFSIIGFQNHKVPETRVVASKKLSFLFFICQKNDAPNE